MSMTAEERNAHYGKLNVRFDERSKYLRGKGYRYACVDGLSIAYFIHDIPRYGKPHTIMAGTVMNADEIVWADYVSEVERRLSF